MLLYYIILDQFGCFWGAGLTLGLVFHVVLRGCFLVSGFGVILLTLGN